MVDEPEPRFNALEHVLFPRYVHDDQVDSGQWNRARAERTFVGTCRVCGGHLAPMESSTERESHIEWSEAACILCGKEYAAPWGKTLRRSSRHTEMPHGWWEWRMTALAERGR